VEYWIHSEGRAEAVGTEEGHLVLLSLCLKDFAVLPAQGPRPLPEAPSYCRGTRWHLDVAAPQHKVEDSVGTHICATLAEKSSSAWGMRGKPLNRNSVET
jgi:hypothetical protein